MKYVQVAELLPESCEGCVHNRNEDDYRSTPACEKQRAGQPAFEMCRGRVWIKDTPKAHLAHITKRLTSGPNEVRPGD